MGSYIKLYLGVSHLQYVDNTIIMLHPEDLDVANMKFLMPCFESMSCVWINFYKSEVMVLGTTNWES
jgi:hypothetical protein